MKIREGFMLRQIADNYIIVPVGKASYEFNGMIKLNETGAFIWKCLSENISIDNLIEKMTDEYNVNVEVAKQDINSFINQLKEANLIE